MIPQHLLESSFTPTSYRPNDPGELGQNKAFYSERNRAAQQATQWNDQMELEREKLESQSELAWAQFDWQKQWEPEKFYAGLDFQREQFDFQKSSWGAEMDEMRNQNQQAMDFMKSYRDKTDDDKRDTSEPYSVYGEGYFDEGGEGYTGSEGGEYSRYDEQWASPGLSGGDYEDFGLSAWDNDGGDWWSGMEENDIATGWD